MHASELAKCNCHHSLTVSRGSNVTALKYRMSTFPADLLQHLVSRIFAQIGKQQRSTFAGKEQGSSPSNARGSTGDEGGFSFENSRARVALHGHSSPN